MAHPAVVECHTTAGDSDYMLKIFARSVDHLDELLRHDLSKLPGVHRLSTVVCLKTIKRQGRIAEWARMTEQQQRRSEEHKSELQSLMRNSYAVFCLKKKKQIAHTHS